MMGLIVAGLVGVLVVVVAAPLALWGLWMETLRERAGARITQRAEAAMPLSCRPGHRAVVTLAARCVDACRPVAHEDGDELEGPKSFSGSNLAAA